MSKQQIKPDYCCICYQPEAECECKVFAPACMETNPDDSRDFCTRPLGHNPPHISEETGDEWV